MSFHRLDHLDEAVRRAAELSRATLRPAVHVAPVPVRRHLLPAAALPDPRAIALSPLRTGLRRVARAFHGMDRRLIDTRLALCIMLDTRWIVTTEGVRIQDGRTLATLDAYGLAEENGTMERAAESVGLGSSADLEAVGHQLATGVAQRALTLLHAVPLPRRRYPIVLHPRAAGLLIHRAVGHLVGGDAEAGPIPLGTRLGIEALTVGDDPTAPGLRGSYTHDDEGTPAQNTVLVQHGVVVAHLHSRASAAETSGAPTPTGHVRTADPLEAPAVRLSNTYLATGSGTRDALIAGIRHGVYCEDLAGCRGSEHAAGVAGVRVASARMIRNGTLAEPVKDVAFAAPLPALLERIDGIAGDFAWDHGGSWCDAGGFGCVPVSTGAPHIRLTDVLAGTLRVGNDAR